MIGKTVKNHDLFAFQLIHAFSSPRRHEKSTAKAMLSNIVIFLLDKQKLSANIWGSLNIMKENLITIFRIPVLKYYDLLYSL